METGDKLFLTDFSSILRGGHDTLTRVSHGSLLYFPMSAKCVVLGRRVFPRPLLGLDFPKMKEHGLKMARMCHPLGSFRREGT